eukprot:4125117-Amphidinium_carterae.1
MINQWWDFQKLSSRSMFSITPVLLRESSTTPPSTLRRLVTKIGYDVSDQALDEFYEAVCIV